MIKIAPTPDEAYEICTKHAKDCTETSTSTEHTNSFGTNFEIEDALRRKPEVTQGIAQNSFVVSTSLGSSDRFDNSIGGSINVEETYSGRSDFDRQNSTHESFGAVPVTGADFQQEFDVEENEESQFSENRRFEENIGTNFSQGESWKFSRNETANRGNQAESSIFGGFNVSQIPHQNRSQYEDFFMHANISEQDINSTFTTESTNSVEVTTLGYRVTKTTFICGNTSKITNFSLITRKAIVLL